MKPLAFLFRSSIFGITSSLAMATSLAAQTAAPASPQADWMTPIGLVLLFGVFYLFFIRPQGQKIKQQQTLLNALSKGDAVVTSSGIYGRIIAIEDRIVTLEIAPNTKIRIDKQSIAGKEAATPGGVAA